MNKFSKRSLGLMLCVGLISTAGVNAVAQPATVQNQNNAQDQQANQAPSTPTSGKGIAAANLPKDAETSVTLETGTANFDWRRSFRQYVGEENETRAGGVELDQLTGSLFWPAKGKQEVDLANLTELQFDGSVSWNKYGGILDVSLANPVLDLANKQLKVHGKTAGTMANPGKAVERDDVLLTMPDLQAEIRDGYLLVYSHKPIITEFARDLVGFYSGESAEPFVATFQIAGMTPSTQDKKVAAPVLWQLFPKQYETLRPPNYHVDDPSIEAIPVELDPRLAECIRFELDIPDETAITRKDLARLQSFSCVGAGTKGNGKVNSLQGLEFAKNLGRMTLRDSEIADIAPLKNLESIEELTITNSKLRSVADIGYQPKLQRLDLEGNQITSVAPLFGLTQLSTLNVNNNRITSLEGLPLENEELQKLYAANNRIREVAPLKQHRYLKEVDLSNNFIEDVAPLNIRGIQTINLRDNYVKDFTPLEPLMNNRWAPLKKLEVDGNYVSDPQHFEEDLRSVVVEIQDGKIRARANDETRPAPGFAPETSPVQGETTAKAGEKIALHVVVTGEPAPSIQWQRRQSDSAAWESIDGATEAKYEFVATADDDDMQIRAHVRNEHGEAESTPVTLSIEKAEESATDNTEAPASDSSAEPTESTEPTESADPTGETKPAEPTESTEPTESADPTGETKSAEPTESTEPTKSVEPTDETKPVEPSTQRKPGSSNSSELGGFVVAGAALAVFGAILSQFAHMPGVDQMIARIRDFLSNFGIRF